MRRTNLGRIFWITVKALLIWSGALYAVYGFTFMAEEEGGEWSVYLQGFHVVAVVGLTVFVVYVAERVRCYGLLVGILALFLSGFALAQTEEMGVLQCDDGGTGECWTGFSAAVTTLAVTAILTYCIFLLSLALSLTKKVRFSDLTEKKKYLLECSVLFVVVIFLILHALGFVKKHEDLFFWLYPLPCLFAFYFGRLTRIIISHFWRVVLLLLAVGMLAGVLLSNFNLAKVNLDLSASELTDMRLVVVSLLFITFLGLFIKPYQYFRILSTSYSKKEKVP